MASEAHDAEQLPAGHIALLYQNEEHHCIQGACKQTQARHAENYLFQTFVGKA